MYPEDRVLVAYMPRPADFAVARDDGWYRIPERRAPKGVLSEYVAFYFGRAFGEEKWAIHYYAPRVGHELVLRRDLLPDEPDHPRANEPYYKLQLGPVQRLAQPIVSLRWRRVTFIHTTWDRFRDATEINDLFIEGGPYVDRLYATLKERGVQPERGYTTGRAAQAGPAESLSIPIKGGGQIEVAYDDIPPDDAALLAFVEALLGELDLRGGAE